MTSTTTLPGGTFTLPGGLTLTRMGYGAMQLAGPHVFGPPADRDGAVAVLREAVRPGVRHIDTADFYGPHVTNEIIRDALHPYPDDLRIVTKSGRGGTRRATGRGRFGRASCAGPSTTTWSASGWTRSTS